MLWMLLLGCAEDFSTLSATLQSGLWSQSPLAGAEIIAYDFGLVETDRVTSGEDGAFSIALRPGTIFYLEMSAADHVTTGLTGTISYEDLAIEDGQIWVRTRDELDQVRQDFAGCPGADGDGAVIEGEIRLYMPGISAAEAPLSATGWARVYSSDGALIDDEPCYLLDDDQQLVYDPEATHTGVRGRFAFFDAPTGDVTVEVGYDIESYTYYQTYYYTYVPEGGVTPMYPAWVEF